MKSYPTNNSTMWVCERIATGEDEYFLPVLMEECEWLLRGGANTANTANSWRDILRGG